MEKQGAWHSMLLGGILLILLLPLLNIPPLFSPPAWGQTVAFRVLFGGLFLLFLWQLIQTRNLSVFIPRGPANLPWILLYALGAVFLLATLFSEDPQRSFWDDPSRGWGTLNFLFYILFAVSVFVLLQHRNWRTAWHVMLGTGVGLSLLAALQNFGLFGDALISYGRPVATVGNPLFLAMTLIPLVFMAVAWFFQERGRARRIILGAIILLFLYAVFLTLSRAAVIGLGAGAVFLLLAAPAWRRKAGLALLALVLLGILTLWYANANPEPPSALEFVPNADTLWYRLSVERGLEDVRFSAWKVALRAAAEKPLLGYGPYNASIAFDRFYDPSLGPINNSIGWWDTSHNIFVDLLVETGIVGLAAFLAFLGALFWKLQGARRRNPELRLQVIGVQAALVGYSVNGLFSFNTFATYLVFFFLVAYAFFLISAASKEQSQSPIANGQSPRRLPSASISQIGIISVAAIAAIWFLWQHNLAPLWVNKEMNVAVFLAENGQCQQALQKAEGLSSPSPSLDYYLPAQHTNVLRACLPPASQDPQTRVLLSLKAADVLDEAAAARPSYSRTYFTKTDYLNIALTYLAEGEQRDAVAQETEISLQKARELSPEREDFFLKSARTARLLGKYELAIERAKQCLEFNPLALDCLWEQVAAYLYMGDLPASDRALEEIIELSGLTFAQASQLAALYQELGYTERLAMPYARLVSMTESPQYAASLALVYKELGNWAAAHETALLVLAWDPQLAGQVEAFLAELRPPVEQECAQGNASSCWLLSLLELTLGNEERAEAARAGAERLGFSTSSKNALAGLLQVHLARNDIPRLLAVYERFPTPENRPVGIVFQLAEHYVRRKEYEKARALLELIPSINPLHAQRALDMLKELP